MYIQCLQCLGHLDISSTVAPVGKRFAYGTGIGRSAKRGAGKNPPGFR